MFSLLPKKLLDLLRRVAAGALAFVLLAGFTYQSRVGDTLESIARQRLVSADALKRANPNLHYYEFFTDRPSLLVPNQFVTIPESKLGIEARWSPAEPFAPPLPTVSELQRHIKSGRIELVASNSAAWMQIEGSIAWMYVENHGGRQLIGSVHSHGSTSTFYMYGGSAGGVVEVGRATDFKPEIVPWKLSMSPFKPKVDPLRPTWKPQPTPQERYYWNESGPTTSPRTQTWSPPHRTYTPPRPPPRPPIRPPVR